MRLYQAVTLVAILALCAGVAVAIDGVEQGKSSALDYLMVGKPEASKEYIVATSTERNGTFIGFHKGDTTYPKLALTADGIQIVDAKGKIRFIDLEELAALDRPKQ